MRTIIDGKGADRIINKVTKVWNMSVLEQLGIFIENFNIHYSLLLKRYARFKEIDYPQNLDVDVMTYLDMILVQIRSFCIEKGKNNYTAQSLLKRLGREDLAERIDYMLAEKFFDYRDDLTVRNAIKTLTDRFVCHYDAFDRESEVQSELIEQQLRNPYVKHNLSYIMKILTECIGEGLTLKSFFRDSEGKRKKELI